MEFLCEPRQSLLEVLREELLLTGAKEGCNNGNCGACNVILNGVLVNSCLVLAVETEGATITTVEGLAGPDKLHPLQQKFLEHAALQCGICTPGFLVSAKALLDKAGVTAGADGSRGKLRLVYDAARPQFVSGGQIIKENLKDIGFDVELQPLERAVMIDKVFANRDYDLTLQSFVSSGDPAIGYHRLYLTNATKTQFLNASGWGSEQVDGLLNKAAVTPDRDARGKLYQEAAVTLAQQLPSIVLFDEEGMDIATKKLNNLWTVRDSRDGWENAWLSK